MGDEIGVMGHSDCRQQVCGFNVVSDANKSNKAEAARLDPDDGTHWARTSQSLCGPKSFAAITHIAHAIRPKPAFATRLGRNAAAERRRPIAAPTHRPAAVDSCCG
jgi:hypothetical protein